MNSIKSHLCVELSFPFQSFNNLTNLQVVSKLTSNKVKDFVNRLAKSYGLRSDLNSDNCYKRSLKYLLSLVKALDALCGDEDGLQFAQKVDRVNEKLLSLFLSHIPMLSYKESRLSLLSFIKSKSNSIGYQVSPKNQDSFDSLVKLCKRHKELFQCNLVQLGLSFDYKNPERLQENFLWAIQHGEKELVKQYLKRGDALIYLENLNIPLPLFLMHVHEQGIIRRYYAKKILRTYYLITSPEHLNFAIDNPIELAVSYIEGLSHQEMLIPMGQDILKAAIYLRETKLIMVIIDAGVSINHDFGKGMTPLNLAVNEGSASVVQLLLDLKADLESRSESLSTPLITALSNGYSQIALLLIDAGASIDARSIINNSCLHIAASKGLLDVVERLLDMNFDIDNLNSMGSTPLFEASEAGKFSVVDLLLKNGANINILNKAGQSPLHVASQRNYEKIAQLLIQSGADIEAKDRDGTTPLHFAARYGHASLAKLLFDSGAKINSLNKNNETPLHLSVKCYDLEVAGLLLECGADIDAVSIIQETPLHVAVRWNKLDLINFLIQKGADINLKNSEDLTPIELAEMSCVAKVLEKIK